MKTFLAALFWTALSMGGVSAHQIGAAGDQHAASVLDEARQLLAKSAQLAGDGQRLEAVQTAQIATNELRGLQPPADGQTAYLWLFTQALYTWTVRLIEAGRPEEAATAARETIQVAGQAAASPDADASAIASLMLALSSQLATAGLRPGAVDAAQAAVDIMREEAARRRNWGERMSRIPAPQIKGCFRATYPNGWQQVPCVEAPDHPYPPAGGGGFNVGNGTDWTATVAGATPISSATGSFDSVTGVTSETGTIFGSGPNCPNPVAGVPNIFSLQLNTKPFKASSLCNNATNQPGAQPAKGSANPLCQGWQQFIYSSTFNIVFIQYWLLNYGATILVNGQPQPACPTGWAPSSGGCFVNSPATSVPAQTIANLRQMNLTASANNAFDTVKILITGNTPSVSVSNQDSVLNLAPNWQDAEFNVFGDSCNSQANFNTGCDCSQDASQRRRQACP